MTWRNRVSAGALAVLLVAGCSSSKTSEPAHGVSGGSTAPPSTAVAPAAAHGVEAALDAVPWAQVGPGWLLATWSPAPGTRPGAEPAGQPTPQTSTTTLYLVSPAGGRYPITTFPPPGEAAGPELGDWSGDGSHAMLYAHDPGASGALTVIMVDLHAGTQSTFKVDNGFDVAPRYSRPQGKAVLLAQGHDYGPAYLKRVDLTGKPELTYPVAPDFEGQFLSTPDGTQLVLGTATGLALMGNDGTPGKGLPISGATDCGPARWWDASSTVLTRCTGHGPARLWLVPISGQPPTALTAPLDGHGQDLGDMNAWQLPAGTFVQDAGACGSEYLAKLSAVGGTTSPVSVPDVDAHSSVRVVGVNGSHLVVQGRASCGGGQALFDYDPAANTSTALLGPPLNGGGVITAIPYPGQS
jgi:hypothetical protein